MNRTQLRELYQVEVNLVNKDTLINIQDVIIDTSQPATKRMSLYLEQIKNPYCFMCGKTPVKIRFSPSGKNLDELLQTYFITLKR